MTKLITTKFKTHIGRQLLEAITEPANTAYYVFLGEHTARSSANAIPTPTDTEKEVSICAYRNMLFGKRLTSSDMKLMIRNIPWESGKKFTMYDDRDGDLLEQDFFCVVNEAANYHVYKCLDNNGNTESTSQPTFAHVTGSNTEVYQTSDGFRWKYIYTFDLYNYDKFATDSFIPVVANSSVSNSAVRGALDVIKIEEPGKNYNNYTSGSFGVSDLRIGGNTVLYAISNDNLSTIDGYYTGCLLYITSGAGAGQYKQIDHYFANDVGSYVVVNSAFSTAPENGSAYEINPRIEIVSDGFQTSNAVARGLVNAVSTNSIYRVEMLNRGENQFCASAAVVANLVVGVTSEASLRPILSPVDGHGYDPAIELGCEHICIGMQFANNENNTIPTDNSAQKLGLLKDPSFANVGFNVYNVNGAFIASENLYKIKPVRFNANATVNTTSAVLTCAGADFLNQVSVGDDIYLKSSDGQSHMLTTVAGITNSSSINISSNALFACTDTEVYQANISSNGQVQSIANGSFLYTNNVTGIFETDDTIIGASSGAKAQINSISRNDVTKGFDTFVQMHKYIGEVTSGSFVEDELIFQGNTANAFLFSITPNGANSVIYTSNQTGVFQTGTSIEGNTSGATLSISDRYGPELVHGSGEVLALENFSEVQLGNNKTQTVQMLFKFGE